MKKSSIRPALAFALAALLAATPATFSDTAYAAKKYANCAKLNKKYPHGVAKPGYVEMGGGLTGEPKISKKLYKANKGKDRDHDGVACEK